MDARNEARDITPEQMDRLIDGTEKLSKAVLSSHSSSGVHIEAGALLAIVVALIGFVGIVVAVAAVFVVAAWRDADMRDLTRVRGDVRELQAYRVIQSDAITKLEVRSAEPSP